MTTQGTTPATTVTSNPRIRRMPVSHLSASVWRPLRKGITMATYTTAITGSGASTKSETLARFRDHTIHSERDPAAMAAGPAKRSAMVAMKSNRTVDLILSFDSYCNTSASAQEGKPSTASVQRRTEGLDICLCERSRVTGLQDARRDGGLGGYVQQQRRPRISAGYTTADRDSHGKVRRAEPPASRCRNSRRLTCLGHQTQGQSACNRFRPGALPAEVQRS